MEPRALFGLPRGLYVLATSELLFQLANSIVQPILTLYFLSLGATILQVGFILSLQSLLMIVARVPLTLLAQGRGERRMLVIAFAIQAATPLLYYMAPSPEWLYLIPFVHVIASASFFQIATSMASNMALPSRQGDALGRYMAIMSLNTFVGPIVCGLLVAPLGITRIFLVAAFFPLAGLLLFLRFAREAGDPIPAAGAGGLGIRFSVFRSIRSAMGERTQLILAYIRTLYSTSNHAFHALFAVYAVRELGFSPSTVAFLFSVSGVSNTLIKFPAGRFSDRRGRRGVLIATYAAIVSVYAALAFVRELAHVGLAILLFGATWGIRAITEWSMLASSVPREKKTMAISFMEMFWDIGAASGSILAGVLAGFLPFSTIFLLLALLNLPALPALYAMERAKSNG